jgi:hypothetical protein
LDSISEIASVWRFGHGHLRAWHPTLR